MLCGCQTAVNPVEQAPELQQACGLGYTTCILANDDISNREEEKGNGRRIKLSLLQHIGTRKAVVDMSRPFGGWLNPPGKGSFWSAHVPMVFAVFPVSFIDV